MLHKCICMYWCMYVCMYVCMNVQVHMYVCIDVCMYECMYVCMYFIYLNIYCMYVGFWLTTHIFKWRTGSGDIKILFCLHNFPHAVTEVRTCGTESPKIVGIAQYAFAYMGYSFWSAARVLLYASSHRQDITYHSLCTPVVEHWLERETAQWVHHEGSIRTISKCSYHGATSHSPQHRLICPCLHFNEECVLINTQWVVGSILHGGLIKLFLVPASAPWLV